MCEYDENLNKNPFLCELQKNHSSLIKKCAQQQWIICVPIKGSLKGRITLPLILDHIIIDKAQTTLSRKPIKIKNREIIVDDNIIVKILFEEIFYVTTLKYVVWCLDQPLFTDDKVTTKIIELNNLYDCMNYLWGKYFAAGKQIREYCQNFSSNFDDLEDLKQSYGVLYSKCLQLAMKSDHHPREDQNFNKFKLSVETFVQYSLSGKLIRAINTLMWKDDAVFNKITRNYTNLPAVQLGIKYDVEYLLKEFNINNCHTTLDKKRCLKQLFEFNHQANSDEILQILVFVIINLDVHNWLSNFIFMNQFDLSIPKSPYDDYILSTFEAAIEFIKGDKLEEIYSNYLKSSLHSNIDSQNKLIGATILNNLELVQLLIDNDDFICDNWGRNPLHYASMYGHQEILLILINNKIDVNVQDNNGNTALHLAANNGHFNCVQTLINTTQININKINKKGNTALHLATQWGFIEIIKILIENKADPWIKNKARLTSLDLASNYFIFKVLQQVPETVNLGLKPKNQKEEKQLDLLLKAIKNNDLPLTSYYLGFATSTNSPPNTSVEKCHPLCDCDKCSVKDNSCTEEARQTVNIINKCNSDGYAPLHFAALYGSADIFRILLDSRANPNIKTYSTLYTPLHLACLHKHLQIVKELVKCGGCMIDAQDYLGNTPLYYACVNNDVKMVEVLLINGADMNVKNFNSETVIGMVQEKTFDKVYKMLKNYVKQ